MAFRLTPPKIQLSENDVERACLDLLRYHGYYPLRLPAGQALHADKAILDVLRRAGVKPRWIHLGTPGIPDYAIPLGFVEVKRPGGKLSEVQHEMIDHLSRGWSLETAVVESVEELIPWLGKWKERP